ncbi:branched-chain amino acid transport system ATP-binding protein [Xanthobacter flavus]|uniref:ABC transporter ATP-binding protein n=1 Tax=Xanthobacter flavus TaxID=281 RepID=A0A9W6FKY3_XANFL|nr:ABC transporter ATP-binding protein [Xanthobacter flavus]MDR6332482.1 branched-chain amino acid transport system ATP-binding protein [Xanthobacter flavus]GLI21767.1 ABC transporter ATP-binding protein [Xanthobacter flavus]
MNTPRSTGDLLEVEGLTCRFAGVTAVDDLSFRVKAGEIKAVIGPNGAGKSTLFNMIAGVTRPTDGAIKFDGARVDRLPTHARARRGIARTFQNLQIFREMSVLENVMVGRHLRGRATTLSALLHIPSVGAEERAMEATAMALLERFGLAAKAGLPAGSLAFGQMKVLELARALASEPRLLLLDEPAAGLPHAEADKMAETIRDLNRDGMTVLLVEHNMRMVMSLSHDILVLNNGRRIAEGTAEEVRCHPEVLSAYLGEEAVDA